MNNPEFDAQELFDSLPKEEQTRIKQHLHERTLKRKKIIYQPLESLETLEHSLLKELVSINAKINENDEWLGTAECQVSEVTEKELRQHRKLADRLNSQKRKIDADLEEIEVAFHNTDKVIKFEEKQFHLYEQSEFIDLLRPIFKKSQRQYWLSKLPHIRKIYKRKEREKTKLERKSEWVNYLDKQEVYSLYYLTHVDNLQSILKHGILSHDSVRSLPHHDISMQQVNERRARREEVYERPIHKYVPLYFNSRNPMLYVRKEMQPNLVILSIDRELLLHSRILVTDGNAASGRTKFMKLDGLRSIDWHDVFASTWFDIPDGRRKRCAEALIPDEIATNHIQSINCNNSILLNQINTWNSTSIPVQINDKLFF